MPSVVLEEQVCNYEALWEPTREDHEPSEIANPGYLDDCTFTGAELRNVAASFSKGTAESYEGIHVRHWSFIPEDFEEVLAKIVALILCQGRVPGPVCAMLGSLLPKATKGYRSVVLYPSIYRISMRR